MIVTPGITKNEHSSIYTYTRDKVEDRGDVFFPFDADGYNGTIATSIATVQAEDTNFASTYYPWVKIVDDEANKHVWVPPSVVVPGVIAFTDKVSHPWFAPAGLNRGGLSEVLIAKDRLTHSERDTLYEGRVNPIATFPGEGVCIWGQKTLQAKPSALDRINVRRLLIALKKFIASSSRYLVFEQNTSSTRNRFLNIVNPYMESVQSNSGLTAFRVVMDETNNTPDVVDRNELRGQIFIQPARTAEFIVLDFVVLPTGATFPE
jgi:phage tail sheath protein FI